MISLLKTALWCGTTGILFSNLASALTLPHLPDDSRAIYRFDTDKKAKSPTASALSAGGDSFTLTVGFKRTELKSVSLEHSHRAKAEELVQKLARRFEKFSSSAGASSLMKNVSITVARIYTNTYEVVLTVDVDDASKSGEVRRELLEFLKKTPGVSFAGSSTKIKVE